MKQQDPPKIHAVAKIALELGADRGLAKAINDLVGDYMVARYPDMSVGSPFGQYTVDDADDRLAKAESIIEWVESNWETGDE